MQIKNRKYRILHLIAAGGFGGIEIFLQSLFRESIHDNTCAFLYDTGPVADSIAKDGFRVLDYSRLSLIQKFEKIQKAFFEKEYDCIINHNVLGKTSLLLALCNTNNKPLIQYIHSCYEPKLIGSLYSKSAIGRLFNKQMYKKASAIICVSEAVRNNHKRWFGPLRNMQVMHNAIDTDRFKTKSRIEEPIHKPVRLLCLSRLEKIKGIQNAIHACELLDKRGIHYQLTIVGDGSYRTILEKLAEDLGVKADFKGSTDAPAKYYEDADVFIHSPSCQEAFGLTLLEAMLAGSICVASRVGGIPEVIFHGENGFLVERNDYEGLASIIESICELPIEDIKSIRIVGKRFAQGHSMQKYGRSYDKMVSDTIEGTLC